MKTRKIMNMVIVAILVLSTAMLCVMFDYSKDTMFESNASNAVAAFTL